jgi:uncharacterized protein with NRDE domain
VCTLILSYRQDPEWPVAVAANRDERLGRPAAPPARVENGSVAVLMPRDLEAGGTWIGLSARGGFAGLTNRFGRAPDRGRRSRGELVPRALRAATARDAWRELRELRPADYNGFHLVVADGEAAFLIWSDGEAIRDEELRPGVHVVTERSLEAAPASLRHGWLEAEARRHGRLDDLAPLLVRHLEPSIDGTCVHLPELGYGTRSSTLCGVGARGDLRFLHADGPPCRTAYQDLSGLLAPSVPLAKR